MLDIINHIENIIDDLNIVKYDLEESLSDKDFELEEKRDLVISMREKGLCIDDISSLTNLSIRKVIDILGI